MDTLCSSRLTLKKNNDILAQDRYKSESFGMFGGKESAYRVLVGKFQAMKQPERHKRIWKDVITMNAK
jgi:hypothetical protein